MAGQWIRWGYNADLLVSFPNSLDPNVFHTTFPKKDHKLIRAGTMRSEVSLKQNAKIYKYSITNAILLPYG